MRFAAEHADYNFALDQGVDEPTKCAAIPARMAAAARTGRDVGSYVLYMLIAEETDAAAMARWDHYVPGADTAALAWLGAKTGEDAAAGADSTASAMVRGASPINFNMGTLVGSYASVARMLDEAAAMPGVKGLMLTFDDFLTGLDRFGERVQPLMRSRAGVMAPA